MVGKMGARADAGVEEADPQSAAFETKGRGLAGAVTCETRDLGIKWPQWDTLLCEGQVAVDVRVALPAGCEEDALVTSQDGPSEEMGQPSTSVTS